jgi:hypothetical protein
LKFITGTATLHQDQAQAKDKKIYVLKLCNGDQFVPRHWTLVLRQLVMCG